MVLILDSQVTDRDMHPRDLKSKVQIMILPTLTLLTTMQTIPELHSFPNITTPTQHYTQSYTSSPLLMASGLTDNHKSVLMNHFDYSVHSPKKGV